MLTSTNNIVLPLSRPERAMNGASALTLGLASTLALISIYFAAVSFISGWDFALGQFRQYWYFIVSLAAGFGIQVGLYVRLKKAVAAHAAKLSGTVVATTGTTSTVAMISCCAHYLATALPILGINGFLSAVGQYQIELFWLGLASNLIGIGYVGRKLSIVMKHL